MQSPLSALLAEVEARCDPTECASLAASAAEAVGKAIQAPGFADVAAVLLAPNVQVRLCLPPPPPAAAAAASALCALPSRDAGPRLPAVGVHISLSCVISQHHCSASPTAHQGCAADEEHVASCKARGTAAFGRGQYRQAALLFSQALQYCDETSGGAGGAQLAARLYCNRALCLSKEGPPRLEAALHDSSCAIACDRAFAKGWYRRACTARALGRGASPGTLHDARRALQLLQEQQADAGEAAALVAELEAEQGAAADGGGAGSSAAAGAEGALANGGAANGHASPSEIEEAAAAGGAAGGGAPNAAEVQRLVAAAGPALVVQQTEDAGRGLSAAEELPAGRDVLAEQPFAFALTKLGRRSVGGCRCWQRQAGSQLHVCARMHVFVDSTCFIAALAKPAAAQQCGLPILPAGLLHMPGAAGRRAGSLLLPPLPHARLLHPGLPCRRPFPPAGRPRVRPPLDRAAAGRGGGGAAAGAAAALRRRRLARCAARGVSGHTLCRGWTQQRWCSWRHWRQSRTPPGGRQWQRLAVAAHRRRLGQARLRRWRARQQTRRPGGASRRRECWRRCAACRCEDEGSISLPLPGWHTCAMPCITGIVID